jgi:hypothetical protein
VWIAQSLIFQEEENAHGRSVEEGKDTGLLEQTERSYEIVEDPRTQKVSR